MNGKNKTELIQKKIFTDILNGRYAIGEQLPPEREAAKKTGASRVTVRRAYGELEKAGILMREQGKGTYVAVIPPQGNRTKFKEVALLTAIREPFTDFLRSFGEELAKRKALFVLEITKQDPEQEQKAVIKLVVRGIRNVVIWPSCKEFPSETFMRMRLLGVNMVFLDRMLPGTYADFVGLDNRHAIELLIEHALAAGMRKLLFVSHSGLGAYSDEQREAAFEEICNEKYVAHQIFRVPWLGDIKATLELNKDKWFGDIENTAILCVNDNVALKVKQLLDGKAMVYGIDGRSEALHTGIVTVKQPMKEMARKAIELLIHQQEEGSSWKATQVFCKGELLKGR